MRKLYRIGLIASSAVLLFVAANFYYSSPWRYKMTVSVETPEGIKTGSAVREVRVDTSPPLLNFPEGVPKIEVKGEAVAVDLGSRGVVFALMRNATGPDYTHMVVYRTIGGGLSFKGVRYLQKATGTKAVLEPANYPTLVMFRDIKVPKTVTPVLEMESNNNDPWQYKIKADHFEELFGKGVKLREITIEITDEKVTWGIEKYIPWLPERKNVRGTLGGSSEPPYDDPTKTYLKGNDFSKGKFW